jgi:anti-anti-sigma factor
MFELADALESFRRKTRHLPTHVLATAPRDDGSAPRPADALERLAVAVRLDGRILWSGDFDHGEIVIGRSHDADVQLDDAEVSWTHALVQWHESGDISFIDRSSNGSFQNGIRIHETHLSSGDVISIPPFEIEWRVVGKNRDADAPYLGTRIRGLPAHPPTERGATAPAPARQTAAMLRFVDGPAELVGRVIPLGNKRNTIGRARACDVRIDFPSISRHHATLAPSGPNRWRLEDAGSRNGVKVNGRLMPEPALEIELGDRVGLGADIVAVLERDATPNAVGTASPASLGISGGVSVLHPQVFVVRLSGAVEGSESKVLQDYVVRAIEGGHLLVILDFTGCARCDAAGFDVVVGLDVVLRRRAGALYLVGMRNEVKAAYRSRRLDRVLFSRDDEASAAAALARIVRTP